MPYDAYQKIQGKHKCPIKGREDCQVHFKWHGRPAIWEDGNVYVMSEEQQAENQKINTWVQNLQKLMRK